MAARPTSSCPSGKRRFHDRLSALIALADIGTSDRAHRQENRAYRCPDCHGWHLTSKAKYQSPQLTTWPGGRRPKQKYQPPRLDTGTAEE